ncbi:2'-deoxycytidine 5'-triphosphate deaminase [Rhodobaculum claviforme]|uniref:2'-deoxycytidine 5'-triphosphate deaminase n=1 Tax=Rhodobaculum claviforme TaxID=1549854 RepID=A0A934TL40_9RHOB|nr:2'-deoxycytidine 5'-triphosphate deaminase [Rhodobaculum claviforme]MBK5927431.1 2'-deoxycytidine 5'-triphosphate deaminase [Rhodobaculum claviforme]
MAEGVLPSQSLRALITSGGISGTPDVAVDQVQPASLDLRLGPWAARVRASFLPGPGRSVARALDDFQMHRMDLRPGAVLEKGCVYVVPLCETLDLPAGLQAAANAKSSTGRLDVLTRVITDEGVEFDRVPDGYSGPLFAEICPRSFSVLVRPGQRLNQLRLRRGEAALSDAELAELHAREGLVAGPAAISGGLAFSVDLRPAPGTPLGYRAKPHSGVIDLDRLRAYNRAEFWEELHGEGGRLILDPGAFYILVSREAVHIPPSHAAEMAPYLAMAGEFRVHYAGFFDPGFGHGPAGGTGARGVLEVRCYEAPFALEHGQGMGRLVYERMSAAPDVLYGAGLASNYQGQGLKLSKHFRDG